MNELASLILTGMGMFVWGVVSLTIVLYFVMRIVRNWTDHNVEVVKNKRKIAELNLEQSRLDMERMRIDRVRWTEELDPAAIGRRAIQRERKALQVFTGREPYGDQSNLS